MPLRRVSALSLRVPPPALSPGWIANRVGHMPVMPDPGPGQWALEFYFIVPVGGSPSLTSQAVWLLLPWPPREVFLERAAVWPHSELARLRSGACHLPGVPGHVGSLMCHVNSDFVAVKVAEPWPVGLHW